LISTGSARTTAGTVSSTARNNNMDLIVDILWTPFR
jgi:hypothetical protein